MLEASGLHKRFGNQIALAGFDLRIEAGEICGLLGHNGAGKTTFARICAGLEHPDAGGVRIGGLDADCRAAHALVGLAPQEIALYPTATLRENLRFYGQLAGIGRSRLRAEINDITASMMLTKVLDRTVATLSGGQQRRAQAATALLHRPAVLLLDEPTAGADPTTRQALLAVVRDRAAQGAAVCYTTHYLPELEELDATIAVAQTGRIIARGDRRKLLSGLPSLLEIGFAAEPSGALDEQVVDGTLRITTDRPAQTLTRILTSLGDRSEQVERVEIREPTLDDLYRHLTRTATETERVH
ncbi:ABC transporter related [Catenulispora acidiphila DSM 44928]|uniref:ABC transporter related n=1 Tax=Catenulispora acidiphila (strain DSM 44928 / JCM 14897 / NBRC 102108 / NRRL B-24433 / ID139908) TaxID=479433 RepID=C7QER4_CATAD|nr:ABC transporter ATP-binding protein [Catenulispora acidiphila]ACU72834.1 ABC transporter related [Catenulispora acidiphila DSM 44928]